jgi:hypothetical protein
MGRSLESLCSVFRRYLSDEASSVDEVRDDLWNTEIGSARYGEAEEKYRTAILEQYKIYVEMADRVSARRALANTFFLTLNTAVLALIGTAWKDGFSGSTWLLALPLVALGGQCAAWFWIVRSYRQLNSAKYAVIGALEEQLPASPYWKAEWTALGRGVIKSRYWPLTHLEQWLPVLFAASYGSIFVALVLA